MAIIKPNNNTISAITALPAAIPTGKVLQVVSMTTTSETQTTSSSFVTTALTDTITPSATSSKILIMATADLNNQQASSFTYGTMYRDSTNLGVSTKGFTGVYSASGDIHGNGSITFLDSPSTTSEITYTYRIAVNQNNGRFNQQGYKQALTLIEIGA